MTKWFIYIIVPFFFLTCQKEENPDIDLKDITDTTFIATIKPHGNDNSPLTAIITTTGKEPHTLEIRILGKYDNDLTYIDKNLSRSHTVPLIGLYPDFDNTIFVKAVNSNNQTISTKRFQVKTDPVNVQIPNIEILAYDHEFLPGRLTFIEYRLGFTNVPFVFDEYGDVRWYLKYPDQSLIRPTLVKNKRYFYCGDFGYSVMYKFDWFGNIDTIDLPEGYNMLHHEVNRNNGHLFFPSDNHYILETDENGKKIKEWNLEEIVKRYLPANQQMVIEDKDWLHVNSVYYQEEDQSLVVSARQSLGVFKLDYSSGNILWILNDTSALWYSYPKLKNLALMPLEGCDLPIGQHSPVPLSGNRILMLDNGYDGYERINSEGGLTDGGKGYSRLVVYEINENNMTVSQDFEYGREQGEILYSKYAGNAGYDDIIGSYYGLFGDIKPGSKAEGRVIEVDSDGILLFEARLTAGDSKQLFSRGEKIDLDLVINE